MCGTFMQIIGQGASLYLIDQIIKPALGGGLLVDMFLFLAKGFVTFYVYKWFQCSTTGVIRNPLHGVTFLHALMGGVVGMFTLMITGMLLNEQMRRNGIDELLIYAMEAVVLNIVYGMGAEIIADMSKKPLGH